MKASKPTYSVWELPLAVIEGLDHPDLVGWRDGNGRWRGVASPGTRARVLRVESFKAGVEFDKVERRLVYLDGLDAKAGGFCLPNQHPLQAKPGAGLR